jgi:hypothetical protein
MKKPRHIGQKIALATAIFCALMMLPALAGFFWLWQDRGLADTWTPSLLAIVAFFGCCAGVLYAMSRPQPVLPPEDAASDA